MPTRIGSCLESITSNDENKILFAAIFHISTTTLISMSVLGLPWFSITGDVCLQHLRLSDFSWYSSFLSDSSPEGKNRKFGEFAFNNFNLQMWNV